MRVIPLLVIILLLQVSNVNAQTDHPIAIHPNGRVSSLLMTSSEYSSWKTNDGFGNRNTRENLVKDIYKRFQDDFDFIFLILNEDSRPQNLPFGRLIKVSNDIDGLGMNIYNNGDNYGSSGKLKAIMQLTQRNFLRNGPSLHELMHNWGNFGIDTHAVNAAGTNLTSTPFRPHWGFTGGSDKGQLGGFKQSTLVDKGNGAYSVESFGQNANGGNSQPYSELELYLMGMIPVSEVSNFDVFSNITSVEVNGDIFDFEASTRTTYTPASLENLLGARVPSSNTSQKDFKLLVVTLTDRSLTNDEWNLLDDHAERFGRKASDGFSSYNFWEATNGVGSIEIANLNSSIITLGVGDNQLLDDKIAIFPNPINDEFWISIKDASIQIETAALYNSIGSKVKAFNLEGTNKLNVDVSEFSSGLYFVKLKSVDGLSLVKKVVIN